MDFAKHKEKILATHGGRIRRQRPRLWPSWGFQGKDVDTGQKERIEDVGSSEEQQGVGVFEPLEHRSVPEEDQLEKEVLLGKGVAQMERHPGDHGEHAPEGGSSLKDLANHAVTSSEEARRGGFVWGRFRVLRASQRDEA